MYIDQDETIEINLYNNSFDNFEGYTNDEILSEWEGLSYFLFPDDEYLDQLYKSDVGSFFQVFSLRGSLYITSKYNYFRGSYFTS